VSPNDVSVTGIDDIPEAAYFIPSLTTVRLDFAAQGVETGAVVDGCGGDNADEH
jgi:DNA-binding LacI/PurR family transcriptional regulator